MLVDTSWMTGSSGGSGNIDAAIFPLSDYFKVSIKDSTNGGLPGTADQHDDSLFGMAYTVGDRTFIKPFGSVAAKWKANSANNMMLMEFGLSLSPGMYGGGAMFSNSSVFLLSGSSEDPSRATSDDRDMVSPTTYYNNPDRAYDEGYVWGFTIGGVGDLEVEVSGYDLDYQKGSVERFFIDRRHEKNAVGNEGWVVGFADKYTLGDKTWVDFNCTTFSSWGESMSSSTQRNVGCFQLPEELWPSEDRFVIGRYNNDSYATFVVITKTGYVYTPGETFLSGSHDMSSPSSISSVMSDRTYFHPDSFSYLL